MILSVAIDLGSTRIKGALVRSDYQLVDIKSVPAPKLTGTGLIREGNATHYYEAATSILEEITSLTKKSVPIGIASQRSTFLLWSKSTGIPVTPLISWQDRRATPWCSARQAMQSTIRHRTGLPLSPHYIGPKLAYLFSVDGNLRTSAANGELLFGTLETYLIWRWTDGRIHQTDITMAARSLLADPQRAQWSDELLCYFEIPRTILAEIKPTSGKDIRLPDNRRITATIADQAAGLAYQGENLADTLLINLGTGGFIIKPTGQEWNTIPGFLTAPIRCDKNGNPLYCIEGPINIVTLDSGDSSHDIVEAMENDQSPDMFYVPDRAGIGAPYWISDSTIRFSKSCEQLNKLQREQVVMEGVIFRIYQIIQGITPAGCPGRVIISGGLANQSFICKGLAACLEHPVFRLDQCENTLLGIGLLAADRGPAINRSKATKIIPPPKGQYFRNKYQRWKTWLDKEIAQHQNRK